MFCSSILCNLFGYVNHLFHIFLYFSGGSNCVKEGCACSLMSSKINHWFLTKLETDAEALLKICFLRKHFSSSWRHICNLRVEKLQIFKSQNHNTQVFWLYSCFFVNHQRNGVREVLLACNTWLQLEPIEIGDDYFYKVNKLIIHFF